MRMRAYDCAELQIMPAQNFEDAVHFIAGIHDDCFFSSGIAEDRAIALQHPDRDDFVDQFFRHRTLSIAALFEHTVKLALWLDLSSRAKSRPFCFPLVLRGAGRSSRDLLCFCCFPRAISKMTPPTIFPHTCCACLS